MWNIFFIGFICCTPSFCDVSHLVRPGYGSHKPDHPLDLPGEGSHYHDHSVHGYPKRIPDNPLQIPDASTGHVNNQIPDTTGSGTGDGGFSVTQQHHNHGHGHYNHHYHEQEGRYNPHDDGSRWDIRNSVPGEPGRDYPVYDTVPTTSFTCRDKVPGYYANEEARCQAFSVCTTSSERTYFNFLCPNGTLFNQRVLTCDWWMNVDCAESRQYFFKNEAIGKMPTGSQFMEKIMIMLVAPNDNPYHFNEEQQSHIDYMREKIHDNDLDGSGRRPIQDLYLPVPESTPVPISTTTRITTTTTTTTTLKPSIFETSVGNVNINEEKKMLKVNTTSILEENSKYGLNQTSTRNITTEKEDRRKLPQSTDTIITQDPNQIDVLNVGTVMVQNELNKTSSSSLNLNKTKGSEIKPGYEYTRPDETGDSSSSGPIGQKIPSLTVTKENTHTITHSEKTTHVFQDGTQEQQQINLNPRIPTITHSVTGLNRQPEIQQSIPGGQPQLTITQEGISTGVQPQLSISQIGTSDVQPQLGLPQQTPQLTIQQHRDSNVQPIPSVSNIPANLNRDEAIQQIEQIQRGVQQITDQQRRLNEFGFGIINPRKLEQSIPVTNFGQFGSASFPAQNYQGYQFPQQNQPNFIYQQDISRPNFNIEFSKDGSSNNYNGHSLTQHTDGQTHTTFTGNNVAFKESTKVDIVPALGFHLNDAIEKSSYISAVLSGLINEGPSYQRTISASTFQQSPFSPADVRYSSYQGPSSYLVPQGSVPRLPNDSGYRYR